MNEFKNDKLGIKIKYSKDQKLQENQTTETITKIEIQSKDKKNRTAIFVEEVPKQMTMKEYSEISIKNLTLMKEKGMITQLTVSEGEYLNENSVELKYELIEKNYKTR
jgi:hypothetical protein